MGKELQQALWEAGFDAFAVMPAGPVERMLPVLQQALDEDRYPAFVERDVRRRIDPRNLQPSAKTVITLAVSYNIGPPQAAPPLHGAVSRYAWGLDYHRVLGERLDRVISHLRENWGARECTKAVDTTFLVDRALAVESGLGFPGSNCSVYVPPYGSWVFLGALLVDGARSSARKAGSWSCPVISASRPAPRSPLRPWKIQPGAAFLPTQMSGAIPAEYQKTGQQALGMRHLSAGLPSTKKRLTRHREFAPVVGLMCPCTLLESSKENLRKCSTTPGLAG